MLRAMNIPWDVRSHSWMDALDIIVNVTPMDHGNVQPTEQRTRASVVGIDNQLRIETQPGQNQQEVSAFKIRKHF